LLRAPAEALPPAAPERVARWVLVALIVFVGYGCLYPFVFSTPAKPILGWPRVPMLADVVANIVIYALIGFVAFGALMPRSGAWLRIAAASGFCLAFSVLIEVAQAYAAVRHSSLLDVFANGAGAFGGAAAAALFRDAAFRRDLDPGTGVGGALLLFALWFACRLAPFVAAIDAQQFTRALAPLGSSWRPSGWAVFHLTVLWLVVFRVIAVLAPRRRAVLAGLAVALALALLRMTIRGQTLSPQEVYGVGLAAAAFALGVNRAWMIALALLGALVLDALAPFTWGAGRSINLMPFRAFIRGWIETALQGLLFKGFGYGALAWLLLHAGLRPAIAILGGGLTILAVELAQQYVPGRYPDITDPIIYVALALAIRQLDRLDLRRPGSRIALGGDGLRGVQSPLQSGGP
jgi:VanZ family protein